MVLFNGTQWVYSLKDSRGARGTTLDTAPPGAWGPPPPFRVSRGTEAPIRYAVTHRVNNPLGMILTCVTYWSS